tara:strand:+ start:18463 stop:18735 length:273 start_codon:yes stop_codon:yes gene_type:complete
MKPDIIGKIPKQAATFNEQGEVIEPAIYKDGWHVNFTQEVPELADYKCDPQPVTPYRVYQGGIRPVCYKFKDKAEWEAVNPFKVEEDIMG